MSDIPVRALAVMIFFMVDIVGCAEYQMIMNMSFIRMGRKYVRILPTEKSFGEFFSNLMCLLSGYFSGGKRLNQMVCQIRIIFAAFLQSFLKR